MANIAFVVVCILSLRFLIYYRRTLTLFYGVVRLTCKTDGTVPALLIIRPPGTHTLFTRVLHKNNLNTMLYYSESPVPIVLLGRRDMNGSEYMPSFIPFSKNSPNPLQLPR